MAQEVRIAGATYQAVPAISVPDSNNVYHDFVDTSDANATASDLASGKTAYVNGNKVTGTATGSTDFVVTISYDSQDDTWKPNCTLAEIQAAYTAGKNIAVVNAYADSGAWSDGWYQDYNQMFVYTVSAWYDDIFKNIRYCLDSNGIDIDEAVDLISPYFETVTKTYTPTESVQTETVTFDSSNYNGLQEVDVTVNAIPSSYVGSGITRRDSTDLSASGATITAPAGYYASAATKTISSGSATPAASISGTSATVSTGTNTLTLSKTVSNTPQVSAGYVAAGTAGNTSVSLTANVTTQGATTYHPSSSNQTINGSRYLTGNQTINAVTTTNLTAANIKSGVTVQVGDSSDSDCVLSVTGTYSGGGSSKNVQTAQGTSRVTSTSLTKCLSLTCSTAGTYDVYWSCARSSTSGTWSSRLYLGGTAKGSEQATWSNHVQNVHLSNISISANQEVAVYVKSRGSNYYGYCPQLTIVQA